MMQVNINPVITGKTLGKNWSVDLSKTPSHLVEDVVNALIDQGVTIILQRSKSGEDMKERQEALLENAARIEEGKYSFGAGGGGGARLTDWDKAEREILALKLEAIVGRSPSKAKQEAAKADEAYASIARVLIIKNLGVLESEEMESKTIALIPTIKEKIKPEIENRINQNKGIGGLDDLVI